EACGSTQLARRCPKADRAIAPTPRQEREGARGGCSGGRAERTARRVGACRRRLPDAHPADQQDEQRDHPRGWPDAGRRPRATRSARSASGGLSRSGASRFGDAGSPYPLRSQVSEHDRHRLDPASCGRTGARLSHARCANPRDELAHRVDRI
ncbi:MAG: hypothetical protein AVDCRST_MAG18-2956, partial [uncultured Thermomicrobiales bacterium]